MDRIRTPLMLRSWVPWLLGACTAITAWAFADNVTEREWVLAGSFALITLGLVTQMIGLWLIRRRATRHPDGTIDADPLR